HFRNLSFPTRRSSDLRNRLDNHILRVYDKKERMNMTPEEKLNTYLQAQSAYDSKAIPGKNAFTFLSKKTGMPQVWTLDAMGKPRSEERRVGKECMTRR